jgi:hypothetical protein
VDHRQGDLETELVDLTSIQLSTLRDCDARLLAPSMSRALKQIDKPRTNLGNQPPGRAD